MPDPRGWAKTQNSRGRSLAKQAILSDGPRARELLEEAIRAFNLALRVRTERESPRDWANTQGSLGNALADLATRSDGTKRRGRLEQAADAYRSTLRVFTREDYPRDWAISQDNLAFTLAELATLSEGTQTRELFEEAIRAFNLALEVRTRDDFPQDWAATQNDLAITLAKLGLRSEKGAARALLEQAIAAHRLALEIHTRDEFPQHWATTQSDLGITLRSLALRSERGAAHALLNQAAEAHRLALEVRTRDEFPEDWANTQGHLGNVLANLAIGSEGASARGLLEQAAHAYRSALQVFTQDAFPRDWAKSLRVLGDTLNDLAIRSEGPRARKLSQEAAEVYRLASQESHGGSVGIASRGWKNDRSFNSSFLRKLRIKTKLSIDYVSSKTGVTVRTIQKLEAGKSRPLRQTVDKLATFFDVPADVFWGAEYKEPERERRSGEIGEGRGDGAGSLGAMRLSEAQARLLRFLHERFPTSYRRTDEEVTPRSKYQPPTRQEALDTLAMEPATWDDGIAFLTAHELVCEVYRHGTEEYEELTLAPGHVVRGLVTGRCPPPDAEPDDERYGVRCYQITAHGIQILKKLMTPSPEAIPMSTASAARSPKVFMSYSWDGPEHQNWVKALAMKLRSHGVDVTLDQWTLAPGDQLPQFMEMAVRENEHVLIICTPRYKEKSNARKGGVGYEGDIMTAEVLNGRNARKFVPLLRQGEWKDVAPSWLGGRFYLDFRDTTYSEDMYEELLNNLYGTREEAPPLGTRPPARRRAAATGRDTFTPPLQGDDGPIKIMGIVLDDIGTPKSDGTPGSALYRVPFQLSRRPAATWAEHFVRTWDNPPSFSTMHRPGIARVEGDRIILDGTTVEEVEKFHRDTLKTVVERVNGDVAEHEAKEGRAEEERAKRLRQHEQSVRDAAKRISFD
jgi:transcriptional regulator with XRE-family HTH domain